MASRTADALRDVNRVIEIGEVRQVVHPNPLQRLTSLETCAHRFQVRAVRPNLLVTIHARGRRGNAGRGRSLDGRMTIATIDSVVADMMLVTELDWLLGFDPLTGVPSRSSDLRRYPEGSE